MWRLSHCLSSSRSCLCSTVDRKIPLSPSLRHTGSPSSPWTPTSGRDGYTCIALSSSLSMTCKNNEASLLFFLSAIFVYVGLLFFAVFHCYHNTLQACPQTSAHTWKQRALQHHPVSHLPLGPHVTAEGLQQLRAGGGLLICKTHIQVRRQVLLADDVWDTLLLPQHSLFFLSSSSDQPPTSFYLVRVISKTPCMVLRLGFPIGTPAHIRNKVLSPKNMGPIKYQCSISVSTWQYYIFCALFLQNLALHLFYEEFCKNMKGCYRTRVCSGNKLPHL